MEKSDIQLPFLDFMIDKGDFYSKPADSKRYVCFKSNHHKLCLKNISFNFVRSICMITEKDSFKEIKLKKLEECLLEQRYHNRI